MRTYARIADGRVVELFSTDGDLRELFHPCLVWVEVTADPAVDVHWQFDGQRFTPPPPPEVEPAPGATLEELRQAMVLIAARLEALAAR